MRDRGDVLHSLRREVAAWRADRRRLGVKHASLRRLRIHASTEWLAERVDSLAAQVAALEAALAHGAAALEVARVEWAGRVDDLVLRVVALEAALAEATTALEAERARGADHERALQVRTVMDWIAQAEVEEDTLVSVVLPTRNRASYLPRAVESVYGQTYRNWELLIVDDASTDDTSEVIAQFDDPRIRAFTGRGGSAPAARNVALSEAKGDVITYVDDDNTMHPDWLKSVVWAFCQRPDVDVLYGAFVIDDVRRILGTDSGALPHLFFRPYEHHALAQHMIADMGTMAHRAGLGEGRFDVTLREMADWDLLLRLTRERPPLPLPVIGCYYRTDSPNRLTNGPTHERDRDAIRERNRR